MKTTCKYLAAVAILCAASWAHGQASPIPGPFAGKEFTLHVTTPEGKKEMLVRGTQGKSDGNLVSIDGTRIVMYLAENQGGETTILSSKCTYDIIKRFGHSSKPVNIRSAQMVINGVGYDLDGIRHVITIRSRVTVRIFDSRQNRLIGRKSGTKTATAKTGADKAAPKKGYTIITSDTLVYDLQNGTVIFGSASGKAVRATEYADKDKETFNISASTMTIFRNKDGQFTRIVALERVVCITPDTPKTRTRDAVPGSRATARRAEYTKSNSTIVFSGNPVLEQGGDVLEGAERAIYINSEKERRFYTEGGRPKYRLSTNQRNSKDVKDLLRPGRPSAEKTPAPKPPQP